MGMGALPFVVDHPVTALRRAVLAHGFQPVPVRTGEKNPINLAWQTIRGLPALSPATLNTGLNCSTLRAIDIDIDDAQSASTAVALAIECLGATPLVRFRATSARRLLVYRGSGSKRIVKTAAGKVEILGKGQQFVAFGVHPDGSEFDWEDATPATFALRDLPEALPDAEDAFAAALLEALGSVEGHHPEPQADQGDVTISTPLEHRPATVHRLPNQDARIEAYVARAFEEELANVRSAPKGHGNATLNTAALKLGQMVGAGWVDEVSVVSALLDAAVPRRPRAEALATIRSGLKAGKAQPRKTLEDRAEPIPFEIIEVAAAMAEAKAQLRNTEAEAGFLAGLSVGSKADWTRPGGLLAEITEWILATSRRPNRPLAVASAAAIISTVCGRHLYGPTGTALNVYIACLGDSGIGKGRPLAAISEALKSAGLGSLHASGKVFSVSGIENILRDTPCCVATIDEMGDELLRPILNAKANSHESRIKTALQVLWSRNIGDPPFSSIARAGQSAASAERDIHCPSFTIWGASTPEAFYGALTAGNVTDGLMNRILIAEAAPMGQRNRFERIPVPQIIVDGLQSIAPSMMGDIGEAMGVYAFRGEVEGRCLQWASSDVETASEKLEDEILEAKAKKPPAHDLMARTFEYAVRLASIHAVSRAGFAAKVTLEDLEWGAAWSRHSTWLMMRSAENEMSESDYEKTMNRIKKVVREAGTISRRDILRKVQGIKAHERDMALTHLIDAGIVEALAVEKKGPGRPSDFYRWHG